MGIGQPSKAPIMLVSNNFKPKIRSLLLMPVTEKTNFQGDIFTDPTRNLFHALGMNIENLDRTPSSGKRRSYIKKSFLGGTWSSIWVRHGHFYSIFSILQNHRAVPWKTQTCSVSKVMCPNWAGNSFWDPVRFLFCFHDVSVKQVLYLLRKCLFLCFAYATYRGS